MLQTENSTEYSPLRPLETPEQRLDGCDEEEGNVMKTREKRVWLRGGATKEH